MPLPTTFTAQNARLAITKAIEARLDGLAWLTVYVGEIPTGQNPPLLPNGGGRIGPYAVIHPSPGRPDVNPGMEAAEVTDALWTGQINFTAGYVGDLLDLLDQAVPRLHLWSPVVAGIDCGPMRPPEGYDAGPVRQNTAARPTRMWTPTLWQIHNATA